MCPLEDKIEGSSHSQIFMGSGTREPNMNVLKNRFISEDEDDVVSLDPPPKIVLDHWDINVVQMFSDQKQALLSAKVLMDLVVSYKSSLRNKTLFYAYSDRLSTYIVQHLNFLHECFHDMEYYRMSLPESTCYYSLLEDVLAIYCSVELKTVSKICFNKSDSNNNRDSGLIVITDEMMYLKRLGKVAQRIAFTLHNFLHRNENVLHVLMKMWYNMKARSCVDTVRYLYTLLLHEKPITDKSDESYCRYVINYLLWILVEKKDTSNKESMMGILNKKFGYENGVIPESPFIKKVLDMYGDKLNVDNMINIKNTVIERYFIEIKKSQQRRMFHDIGNDDSRQFESFLFDAEAAISSDEPDIECYESDSSDDVVEIITLDSDEDDEIQVIPSDKEPSSSGTTSSTTTAPPRIRPPPVPTLHLHTPLIAGSLSTAARNKVQRPPRRRPPQLDNSTLSVLHTIAEAARKAQNSEHSVSDSAKELSDISERLAAKRMPVRGRGRSSVDVNSVSESENSYPISPPSSSVGTPDNNYTETSELEVYSPKCSTSAVNGGVHSSTNSANLLPETPESQDERLANQSFELHHHALTDSEDRDANSGLDEDHDTGQEQRKRREIMSVDSSPTSLSKRRKMNGDITNTLLSPVSLPMTNKDVKDTADSKSLSTPGILFSTSISKRTRHISDTEDKMPWEQEPHKEDDIFPNSNNDRLKDVNNEDSSTKSSLQSTTTTTSIPGLRYPASPPPAPIPPPKIITLPCYKVPPVEYVPPVLVTTENGVKGLLGSDIALLEQQAVEVDTLEVFKSASMESPHTEYIRDKDNGFMEVVRMSDNEDERIRTAMRKASRRGKHVDTEDGDGRRMNRVPAKDILKEACADLLHDADQDETIGTTSPSHSNTIHHSISIITTDHTKNLPVGLMSPASATSSGYSLHAFDNFEKQFQRSRSAASSINGSAHGDDLSTLPNGLLTRITPAPIRDIDDGLSDQSFSSAYQMEQESSESNNVVTSPTIVDKQQHGVSKGISAHVSSSSSDASSAPKILFNANPSLKQYLLSGPSYVNLSLRKGPRITYKRPSMGRHRPTYTSDEYFFPMDKANIHSAELYCDNGFVNGTIGLPVGEECRPKGNISYPALSTGYSENTQDNNLSITSNNSPSINSDLNDIKSNNIVDVSYTVSSSNDSICLNNLATSLTITIDVPKPEDLELEFSNSPKIFEETTKGLLEHMALQTDNDSTEDNVILVADSNLFLANNTNYYLLTNPSTFCSIVTSNTSPTNVTSSVTMPPSQAVTNTDHSIKAITATSISSPTSTSFTLEELTPEEEEALNKLLKESMANMNSPEDGTETRLPFKKRRMSVSSKTTNIEASYQQGKRKQRKQAKPDDAASNIPHPVMISYPATKMISIAEVQEQNGRRSVKTAAERKEMPNVSNNALPAAANACPFPQGFYPCNGIRSSGAVLNIPPPQSYTRSYQYASAVLPPPLPSLLTPSTRSHTASVASAYYSSLLTPQQFAASMIPAIGSTEVGNSFACHHRLSGSVMAAATLSAPQRYKPQRRNRSAVAAKKDITTAARTRPAASVQYK